MLRLTQERGAVERARIDVVARPVELRRPVERGNIEKQRSANQVERAMNGVRGAP
jgi:hypothetical protein